MSYSIEHYHTADGVDVFERWLVNLADPKARARVMSRLYKIENGLLGDCKPVQQGVWEFRIDYGPGYRIYYSLMGTKVVLLLSAGDKRKQRADIERAVEHLQDYKRRFYL